VLCAEAAAQNAPVTLASKIIETLLIENLNLYFILVLSLRQEWKNDAPMTGLCTILVLSERQ
jgi:hypothetical protein